MYNKVEEAIHFLFKANKGQKLKYENMDRSFHSIIVGNMIKDIGETEEYVVAAILHDIINKTDYGFEDIEETFGPLVADIVYALSEDLSITKWFLRKKEYIKRMKEQKDVHIINIMLADKLHTLLMLYDNFKQIGEKVWKITGGSMEENSYIFKEAYHIALEKGANPKLLERYKKLIKVYFETI